MLSVFVFEELAPNASVDPVRLEKLPSAWSVRLDLSPLPPNSGSFWPGRYVRLTLVRTVVVPSLREARRVDRSSRCEDERSNDRSTWACPFVVPWSERNGVKFVECVTAFGRLSVSPSLVSTFE